jgi:hypothetical protein
MALDASEIGIVKTLIGGLKTQGRQRPRVLLLGYPDSLFSEADLKKAGVDLSWNSLPKLPVEQSAVIWRNHGFPELSDQPMVETKGMLNQMGADVFVVDFIRWGGEDLVLDLNKPVRFWTGWRIPKADLIVDPGTLEHCFNVAQAFDNVDRLLAPGGIVFHQSAAAFPNHGFWSISPTAFFDFYQSRGYELGYPKVVDRPEGGDPFVNTMKDIDPFVQLRTTLFAPMTVRYSFRKPMRSVRPPSTYPTQRCYSALPRQIPMTDLLSGAARPSST